MSYAGSHWVLRFFIRVLAYTVLGGIATGASGGALGFIVGGNLTGGNLRDAVVASFGGAVGVIGGAGLGAILFFVAAFLSNPYDYWSTFRRVLGFSILGMNLGALGGSISFLAAATLLFIFDRLGPGGAGGGAYWKMLSDGAEFIYGAPCLMLLGQLLGALYGMRKRGEAQEDIWEQKLIGMYLMGALVGGAISTFHLLGNHYQVAEALTVVVAGFAGGASAGILVAALGCFAAMWCVASERRQNFFRRVQYGFTVGVGFCAFYTSLSFLTLKVAHFVGMSSEWFAIVSWLNQPSFKFLILGFPILLFSISLLAMIWMVAQEICWARVNRFPKMPVRECY